MIFDMPVRVIEDRDAVLQSGGELRKLGKRALVVTGRSSAKRSGALRDLETVFLAEGISYEVFDGVEENPSVETVLSAADRYRDPLPDFVAGIGGGSPMDAAKAIAVMLLYPGKSGNFLYEKTDDSRTLPVVLIPTTCGTGSEVTKVSVLTVEKDRTKRSIAHRHYPVLALLDPKYLKSAPLSIIRSTAADAFAHLVESTVNSKATDFSRMVSDAGFRLFSRVRDKLLLRDGSLSDEDYQDLLNVSLLAGVSIAQAGTSIPHTLSYKLTYTLGTPHGKASAVFLPGYLREADPAETKRILELSGFNGTDALEAWLTLVLGPVDASPELLREAVEETLAAKEKLKNAPFSVDRTVLERIAGIG